MNYEDFKKLENDIKAGTKHFYINNKKLEVKIWYDCFISTGYENEDFLYFNNDCIYFNIEGTTTNDNYFNIKSSDRLAKRMSIR